MINLLLSSLSKQILYILLGILLYPTIIHSSITTLISFEYYLASTNYTNKTDDVQRDGVVSSTGSRLIVPNGPAFVLPDISGNYDACQKPTLSANISNGIAIIRRGGNCTFSVKITRAKEYGAAGKSPNSPK